VRRGGHEKYPIAITPRPNHWSADAASLIRGSGKEMEFRTEKQIAKIMIAIANGAERARRMPSVSACSMDLGLQPRRKKYEWTRSQCLTQT
jgi:hypothetical protein